MTVGLTFPGRTVFENKKARDALNKQTQDHRFFLASAGPQFAYSLSSRGRTCTDLSIRQKDEVPLAGVGRDCADHPGPGVHRVL